MSDIWLTQAESDALMALEKYASSKDPISLPILGGSLDLTFASLTGREDFVLNYTKHSINLAKRNHHLRGKKVIGLARLDLDGPPHRNPDGVEVGPRHLHLYKEGFGLKWAFDIPENTFSDLDNAYQTLLDFMAYCNVVELPDIRKGLFS